MTRHAPPDTEPHAAGAAAAAAAAAEAEEARAERIRMIADSAAAVLAGDRARARALRFTGPGLDRDRWRALADLGWLALRLPEEDGGLGLGMGELCALARAMGAELAPEPVPAAALVAGALPAALRAELLEGSALVLPAFAPWPGAPRSGPPPALAGGRLSGTTAALPLAEAADAFLVETGPGSAALLRAGAPGLALDAAATHDGGRIARLVLDAAPAEPVAADIARLREEATLAAAAELLGLAETAFALTLAYVKDRRQFGQPIGAFQALQHRLVDLRLELALTEAAVDAAAAALDAGTTGAAAARNVSLAHARASRGALAVTRAAIQLHGGIGYTDEADIGLYLRRAMTLAGLTGSERFHRARAGAAEEEEEEEGDGTAAPAAAAARPAGTDMNALDAASFRATARAFIEATYPPEIRNPPRRLRLHENRAWYRVLSEQGWIAPAWPREHGGMGLSAEKQVIWIEELERHGCARLNDHGITMLGPLLIRHGTEAQKARFLPRILSGEDIWCQGYSEPGAGSDLAALRTRAVPDGDDWVIDGQKIWTTLAHDANWMFLLARTDASGRKQDGISFLLVPMDAPGVTVRPILNLERHDEFCEVFLDAVRVPRDHLVGEAGKGWAMARALLDHERLFLGSPRQAAQALAQLDRLGRHLGCADDPLFRDALARHRIDLDAHKALFAAFLRRIARGEAPGAEMSLLKISQSELFARITDDLIAWAGPDAGRIDPLDPQATICPAGQFLQARAATIYGGSSEIQKNIIARAVLNLPKQPGAGTPETKP